MGISICKSCKNVACIWIVILFILCDFFSCILEIDYQKWTNFGFEITRFIKTIMLSLQDPPIFDMYERKCIYIYIYIYKVFTLVKVPMYKHYDRINDSWLLTPDSYACSVNTNDFSSTSAWVQQRQCLTGLLMTTWWNVTRWLPNKELYISFMWVKLNCKTLGGNHDVIVGKQWQNQFGTYLMKSLCNLITMNKFY